MSLDKKTPAEQFQQALQNKPPASQQVNPDISLPSVPVSSEPFFQTHWKKLLFGTVLVAVVIAVGWYFIRSRRIEQEKEEEQRKLLRPVDYGRPSYPARPAEFPSRLSNANFQGPQPLGPVPVSPQMTDPGPAPRFVQPPASQVSVAREVQVPVPGPQNNIVMPTRLPEQVPRVELVPEPEARHPAAVLTQEQLQDPNFTPIP